MSALDGKRTLLDTFNLDAQFADVKGLDETRRRISIKALHKPLYPEESP